MTRDWGGEFDRLDQMAMADPMGLRDYAYDLTVGYDQVVTECERLREAMREQTRKHQQWNRNLLDARIEGRREGYEKALSKPEVDKVRAKAWDEGYEARERDERREAEHAAAPVQSGCDCMVPTENPYEEH